MREFEYHAPSTTAEALDLLEQYGDDGHPMAGGASLLLLMQQGLITAGHIIALRGIQEMKGISATPDGGLEIRALTTHRQAERSPEVRSYCPTLAENFSRVATIRIRNQGTVGGNLVHADPAQDPPPMLMVLDGEAIVASKSGERSVPLDGFFRDFFETAVQEGEVLKAVRLPPMTPGTRSTYVKFLPRTEDDYATVSVAATLRLGPNNVCEDVRVALGSAGPVPLRAKKVEQAVRGQQLTPDLIASAAELVRDEVDPISDVRGSANYKREMARVWVGRALRSLLDGSNGTH